MEHFGKTGGGREPLYKDRPFVSITIQEKGGSRLYFSTIAAKKLDIRENEGVRFARHGTTFFVYRCEEGAKGSLKLLKPHSGGHGLQCSCASLIQRQFPVGHYELADPIFENDVDLFELIPIK